MALCALGSISFGVRKPRSGITKELFGSSAEGVQISRRGGRKLRRGLKAGHPKFPLGRGQTGWVPSRQALGPKIRSGRQPKAAEGAKRAGEGRPEKTLRDTCQFLNHNQRQAARHRQQRLFFGASEWRCNL